MRVKTEITAMSYIWNILRRQFSQNLVDGVKGIKLLKDRHGAAFDIPESLRPEMAESADANSQTRSFTIEFPKELPDLVEEERSMARPGQQPYYGRGGYGQSSGYDRRGGSTQRGSYGRGQSQDAGDQGQRRRYGDKGSSQNKLFVGNLSYNTDDVALKDTFSDAGFNVVDSFVIRGTLSSADAATKNSRGFGYVLFRSPDEVQKALQMGSIMIDGRPARLNQATNSN